MHGILTPEFVIPALLVTTFTCAGLLAVWAATSPRHWFTRTFVAFAVLAPLLIVPAYDLFLAFVLSVGMTCFLVLCIRWHKARRARRESGTSESARPSFSLKAALLLVAVFAVALGVVVRVPIETWQIWPGWSVAGLLLAGSFSLTAIGVNSRLKWRYRVLYFIGATFATSVCFVASGQTLLAMTTQTPFVAAIGVEPPTNIFLWGSVALAAVSLLCGALLLCGLSTSAASQSARPAQSTWRSRTLVWERAIATVSVIAIAFLPAATVWELAHPLPIPEEAIPQPSGMAELEKLGARLSQTPAAKLWFADVIDYERLATAVANQSADYDQIETVLRAPGWISTSYDLSNFIDTDKLSGRRGIAYLLVAKSETAIRANKLDDAFHAHRLLLRAGEYLHQGGLAVDFLVASAVDQTAYAQIYKSVDALSKQQALDMLRELATSDDRRRGIDDVLYRERVFMQRSYGWIGRLSEFIERICARPQSDWQVDEAVMMAHRTAQTIARLLMLKLAIHAYQVDHGELPAQLSQLKPDYLPSLPADPGDPANLPLRYRLTGNGYVLYSVGDDGDDDGGRQPTESEASGMFYTDTKDGDLCLDEYFAQRNDPVESDSASDGDVVPDGEIAPSGNDIPLPN